jgi:proline dehydrogenase
MSIARSAFLRASKSRWLAERFMRRPFARRAVKRFMPGEELSDALAAAKQLTATRLGSVITRLGETLTGESQADGVRDHYLGAYDQIQRLGLPAVISVKPTQMGLDLSFDSCLQNLAALASKAKSTGSQLWIDMEDSSYVDRTMDLYRRLRAQYEPVGLCMQAYLRRTPNDLESLLSVQPWVRLVKGAYAEPAEVAFPSKKDVDKQYLSLSQRLLEAAAADSAFPVFGTHDMDIVRQVVTRAARLNVAPGGYEIHMLYGIRSAEQRALAGEGRVVRCLISYGNQWFPWYMRRLAERPANAWFVLRSVLGG